MLPIGAIAVALYWAAKAARGASQPAAPQPRRPVQRSRRSVWSAVGPLGAAATGLVVYTCLVSGLALWKVAPLLLAGTILTFPWPIASRVFVPLGWVRPAFWLARLSTFWISRDEGVGGGVLAAALAAGRRPTPKNIAWVEAKLADGKRLHGATLVASAAIAHARGDRDAARSLFEMTDHIAIGAIPGTALRVSMTWRLADAADRGDWHAVARLGQKPGVAVLEARFLRLAALRILRGDRNEVSDIGLIAAWLVSSHRIGCLPILRRALDEPALRDDSPAKIPTNDPLAEAVVRQARTEQAPRPLHASDVLELAAAWDRVFTDPALAKSVEERARKLGADPARVMRRLRDSAVEDLADLALDANVRLASRTGGVGAAALGVIRARLLGDVEIAAAALSDRVNATTPLSPHDEWREFTALRALHVRAARSLDIEGRRMSFRAVSAPLCSHGVWLFNKRDEKVIANAIFRWLLEESKAVGDSRLSELYEKNVACGIT